MSFLREIKRRKVFQVAAVYVVVAWLIIQVVGAIKEPLNLPDWLDTVVIVLLGIAFPIAVILAWAFDVTPEGIVRDKGGSVTTKSGSRTIELVLIGLLVLAVGWIGFREFNTPSASADILPNSVAVLPFENLSPDPDNAYFAAGIHDEVITWRWPAFAQAVEPGDEEALGGASRSLARAQTLAPANPLVQAWEVYVRIALGDANAGAAGLRLLEQLLGDVRPIVFLPELAYAYARIGSRDDVARVVEEIERLENSNELGAGAWAVTYLAMGDEARALEQLEIVAEKARNHEPEEGYYNVMNLKMNYLADPVLEQREFVEAFGRIRGD